ncbi:MAG TPA: OmpA family protein, partial [Polyangiales bacterium]|nr:OmpA family protein [Polyangiales bacterium]
QAAPEPEPQPMAALLLPDQLPPAEAEGEGAAPAQREAEAEAEPSEQALAAVEPPPAHDDAAPEAAVQIAAQQPPAPPGHAQLPSEAYAPPDPSSATPVAIRAALRAVRVALQGQAAASGTGPFAASGEELPFAQIYFSLGNFMLGPNGKQVLERMLPQLASDARPILIVGSADPSGSEQINEKLSDARAQSVAEWLLTHGIDAERIQTRAIGHEGAVGSTLDRRVDIWLGGSR